MMSQMYNFFCTYILQYIVFQLSKVVLQLSYFACLTSSGSFDVTEIFWIKCCQSSLQCFRYKPQQSEELFKVRIFPQAIKKKRAGQHTGSAVDQSLRKITRKVSFFNFLKMQNFARKYSNEVYIDATFSGDFLPLCFNVAKGRVIDGRCCRLYFMGSNLIEICFH